ncbi:MAG: hypothetical protein M3Q18_07020 [Actinomycetota bacterium]|nr:hypothetical protein [Actinomycetota bacterium]
MSEHQAEVLAMIETVAKNRGENVAIFMDSNYGNYWTNRYYRAEPDMQQELEAGTPTYEKAAARPETNGFVLLRARARELLQKDSGLSEQKAIMKAADLHPDLVESHEAEMRRVVGA